MGRRRAHNRSGLSHLRGIKNLKRKDEAKFRTTLMTGEEVDAMFATYHEEYVAPILDILNYILEPWYKRLWFRVRHLAKRVKAKFTKEKTDEDV